VSQTKQPLFGRFSPFVLVFLGGLLTLLGTIVAQVFTTRSAELRLRFESHQARHQAALGFLDQFSQIVADRDYAAADYLISLRKRLGPDVIGQKEQDYASTRKTMITRTPMFGARGHDFFGDDFKDNVFYRLSTEFEVLDQLLLSYRDAPNDELEAKFYRQQDSIHLLHGQMLGLAMRKLKDAD
jgi:hypothetical protein